MVVSRIWISAGQTGNPHSGGVPAVEICGMGVTRGPVLPEGVKSYVCSVRHVRPICRLLCAPSLLFCAAGAEQRRKINLLTPAGGTIALRKEKTRSMSIPALSVRSKLDFYT